MKARFFPSVTSLKRGIVQPNHNRMRTGPNSRSRISLAQKKVSTAARTSGRKTRGAEAGGHMAQWWERDAKKPSGVRCSSCGSVFVGGHWHQLGSAAKKSPHFTLTTCPACAQEKKGKGRTAWAGELTIRGMHPEQHADVLAAIHAFGKRARSRDPEERILSIDAAKANLVIHTSQNQTVVRLGKKLDSAFKGGKLDISYSKDDLPIRVVWQFPARSR